MAKITTIITFLLIGLIICGQNSFELRIQMPNFEVPGDLIIDDQGNYVIAGASLDVNTNVYSGILLKVSASGELVTNVTYSFPDSTCLFSDIIKLESNYLVFGGIGPISSGLTSIMICSFDFDLNFQWRKCYSISDIHVLGDFNTKIDLDSNIVVLGSALNEFKNFDADPFEFRCNQQGDSILMAVETIDYPQLVFDFLIKPDSSGYISFGEGNYPSYPSYHTCGAYYNRSFIREQVVEVPDERFHSSHTVRWISDHEFFISGKKIISVNYSSVQGAGLKKMDTSFSILNEVDFAHIPDTICYPGWDRNFDYLDINNILFTWTKNYDDWFQSMPSWIVLTKFDSSLNTIYERHFGGDVMYSSYQINATDDGGCIISGIRYDYNIPGYDYDLYLIKTDENGLVTSINEEREINDVNILVSPNPCTNKIAFNNDLSLIKIFNQSGQMVLSYENYSNLNSINVGHFEPGIYFYRVLDADGCHSTGKIIKL